MRKIERTISINDLKNFEQGVLYGEITATDIYLKIDLTQTVDDMGIFTDLPYKPFGDICADFNATIYVNNITCFDGQGTPPAVGSIQIVPYGGLEPYTYLWDDGTTSDTLENLPPSTHNVTVTDAYGCELELTATVTVTPNADPNVYASFSTDYYHQSVGIMPAGQEKPISALPEPIVLCVGETATLNAESGFVTYTWYEVGSTQPIGNTQQITIDTNGSYYVVVTDVGGCEGESEIQSIEFIVSQTPVIVANNIPSIKPDGSPQGAGTINNPYVVCPYSNNSTQSLITLSVVNPSAYYSFKWNTGSNTSSISIYNDGCYGLNNPVLGLGSGVQSLCDPLGDPLFSNVICIEFATGLNCSGVSTGNGQSG